ncbi:hypothetical protein [Ralstonia sp. ASV6]|uniref:hypothetical protein n=1 Tax=Ralstonia sp. ASV6 TaxID=2795124 RepID=UPI0018EE034F|nr:hypothetical protein [Ralstonia sp. ASV6]
MPVSQVTIPESFSNRWRIAGWVDEHEHAGKLCQVVGYEHDEDGKNVVRVQFIDRTDLFECADAVLSPHMLLPV